MSADKQQATADYALVAQQRWQLQTQLQKVTDDLAQQQAVAATQQQQTQASIKQAVARYAATHPANTATDRGVVLDAQWVRLHDAAATGRLPAVADTASGSAATAAAALNAITGNYAIEHTCARRLAAWQEWWEKIGKAPAANR